MLIQWLRVNQAGGSAATYLKKKGYETVAIYGMKELGELLLGELKKTDIFVPYAIDRDADSIFVPIDIYKPTDELKKVDAVIVTAIHYYEDIQKAIRDKVNCPIISLEEILFEA